MSKLNPTTSLQKIHAALKRTNAPFYVQRSKAIDNHFVVLDYNKYSCSIAVYKNIRALNNADIETFFNKNGKEIQDLFMRK